MSQPSHSKGVQRACMIVVLACASLPCLAQPPELSALPEQFRTRTELVFVEFAVPELNRTQQTFTLEANSWYLHDKIIVALEYAGKLEVVSWNSWVEDYSKYESSTKYFLDPDSKSFLNRGGNNNYGPGEITFEAAALGSLHNASIAATTSELWAKTTEGSWALRLPYAPKVTRIFATEAGKLTAMNMNREGNGTAVLVRTEVYRGGRDLEMPVGDTIVAENWATIRPGSKIQISLATSKVVDVEILPADITEEEVLATLTNGLLEIRLEEYFDADSKTVTSMRRGVTAPARSPVGDKEASVVFSQDAPPVRKSRVGMGGIVLAILAGVALIIGIAMRPKASSPKRSR